jgi:repressor LexA
MQSSFCTILKQLRVENNLSQQELADALQIGRSTLANYEQGKRNPDFQTLKEISRFFNVDIDYLLDNSPIKKKSTYASLPLPKDGFITITLYDNISCGSGAFIEDNIIDYITLPESILPSHKEYFAQYAAGDSMINENIKEGDLLIFEKTNLLQNGHIGCFCIDSNIVTCKTYRYDQKSGIIMLLPANNKYDPITITLENQNFRIIGKLALKISKSDY